MNIVATNVEITVGTHQLVVDLAINDGGNIEIIWKDDIYKILPDGFCVEGYNDTIIIYPYEK